MNSDERWFPSHLVERGRAECLELLAQHQVLRVADCDDLGPVVVPMNYALDQDTILIQLSPYSTLAARLRTAPGCLTHEDLAQASPSRRPGGKRFRVCAGRGGATARCVASRPSRRSSARR